MLSLEISRHHPVRRIHLNSSAPWLGLQHVASVPANAVPFFAARESPSKMPARKGVRTLESSTLKCIGDLFKSTASNLASASDLMEEKVRKFLLASIRISLVPSFLAERCIGQLIKTYYGETAQRGGSVRASNPAVLGSIPQSAGENTIYKTSFSTNLPF